MHPVEHYMEGAIGNVIILKARRSTIRNFFMNKSKLDLRFVSSLSF
jgi:hypothetical protein